MKEITLDVSFLTLGEEAQWNCKKELQRENWKLPSLESAQISYLNSMDNSLMPKLNFVLGK